MSVPINSENSQPTYPTGHPHAGQPIPRDNCQTCPDGTCASFYTLNPGTVCGCECAWHSHQPIQGLLETVPSNSPWYKGGCQITSCTKYFGMEAAWGPRPLCVCGGTWQSHLRLDRETENSLIHSQRSARATPRTSALPERQSTSTFNRAPQTIPSFNGFLQQGTGLGTSAVSDISHPITLIADPPNNIHMSANFIRQYRARSEYATVPPIRRSILSRALAPKPISSSRVPSSVASLQLNAHSRGRGGKSVAPGRLVIVKKLATAFDFAFIPFPLPPVRLSIPMDRDLRLLEPGMHEILMRRLERFGLFFSIDLPLGAEGDSFLHNLEQKVSKKLEDAGVILLSSRAGSDQTIPRTGAAAFGNHSLPFRFLVASSKSVDSKFKIYNDALPFNLEILSKAPFGRIPNPITPQRSLLFIAPAHGLPLMQCPADEDLRRSLRFSLGDPHRSSHACIGLRIVHGYVNSKEPRNDVTECLRECPPILRRVADLPARATASSSASLDAFQTFCEPSDSENEIQTEPVTVLSNRASMTPLSNIPRTTLNLTMRGAEAHREFTFKAETAQKVGTNNIRSLVDSIQALNPTYAGFLLSPKLTAPSVEAAANAIKTFLLRHAASRYQLSYDENEHLTATSRVAAGASTWTPACSITCLFHPRLSIMIEGERASEGNGVRTAVLRRLVELLTVTTVEGLWVEDGNHLFALQTTELVPFPAHLRGRSSTTATKSRMAASYASGNAALLLLYHDKMPSSISPILLAIALLPSHSRTKVATPAFLKLLFIHPGDQAIFGFMEASSSLIPIQPQLLQLMEAIGMPTRSNVTLDTRTKEQHEWVLFKTAMGYFGIKGVANTGDDDPEVLAFVEGIRRLELAPGITLESLLTQDASVILSTIVALYDRRVKSVPELLAHIEWNYTLAQDMQSQMRVKEALTSFLCGVGVPPLAAFSVSADELASARQDPCFRAGRLLEACTSTVYRPFGRSDHWITVDFETAPTSVQFAEKTSAFQYHSCLGSVTIFLTPTLQMMAETLELFDAFVFRNLSNGDDFSGEYFGL